MKIPSFVNKILTDYFRWLAIALVVAVFVFGYVGLIAAKIQTIRTTGFLEQKKVQAELTSRQQFLSELRESVQRFETALPAEKLRAVDEFIPSKSDFPGLLLTMRNIASAANLDLNSFTVSEVGQLAATGPTASAETEGGSTAAVTPTAVQAAAAAGVNLQVLNVSIVVGGGQSYEAFKNFVSLVESSQRLLDVTSLSFSVSDEGGNEYTMEIRTYYLPPAPK